MNEYLIDAITYSGKLMSLIRLVIEIITGESSMMKIIRIEDDMMFITFIWVCTKLFDS